MFLYCAILWGEKRGYVCLKSFFFCNFFVTIAVTSSLSLVPHLFSFFQSFLNAVALFCWKVALGWAHNYLNCVWRQVVRWYLLFTYFRVVQHSCWTESALDKAKKCQWGTLLQGAVHLALNYACYFLCYPGEKEKKKNGGSNGISTHMPMLDLFLVEQAS